MKLVVRDTAGRAFTQMIATFEKRSQYYHMKLFSKPKTLLELSASRRLPFGEAYSGPQMKARILCEDNRDSTSAQHASNPVLSWSYNRRIQDNTEPGYF